MKSSKTGGLPVRISESLHAIASVAYKELLHIFRDWRILILIITLPPLFTLIFGYAFEAGDLKHVPCVLQDQDGSEKSRALVAALEAKETFTWKIQPGNAPLPDFLKARVNGAVIIPKGWGAGLASGEPFPLKLIADGSDTSTAQALEGALKQVLGEFQMKERDAMIDNLPDEVIDMGKKLPQAVRDEFSSAMEPWTVTTTIIYNPRQRFIDYVIPGIIGLILQLLTVTLMACTITRERESGTLYQLMVTSLRRSEIIIGKVLPYLVISLFLILVAIGVAYFHFGVQFHQPADLALLCFLFLVCSLGMGLLISAFSNTQTQAIQLAVFYLLPVFPLSGAFAPLHQLPHSVQIIAEAFPLTHFCRAFRLLNLNNAGLPYITGDLVFLLVGAFATCAGAGLLLKRIQQ